MPTSVETSRAFRVMGTDAELAVVHLPGSADAAERALDAAQQLLLAVDRRLSRFRPESELSLLNAAAGEPRAASPLLFCVTERALAAARWTGGLFDPTVLRALERAGYDRSFELVGRTALPRLASAPGGAWSDVVLNRAARTIALPAGFGLDLGGIAKGWAADRTSELLSAFRGSAVDLGGDIRTRGAQADGGPWTVGIEDPHNPGRDLEVLALGDAAVATSSTRRRRWTLADGATGHHLIDPRTASPSTSGAASCTVIAADVERAEVAAKVAVLLGPRAGTRWLARQGLWGLLVDDNGGMWRPGEQAANAA